MAAARCRTIRLWLQAPQELSAPQAELLDAHLTTCPDCTRLKDLQMLMDERIRESLSAAADTISVRRLVRAQIVSGQAPPWRAPLPRRRRWWSVHPVRWQSAPLVAGLSVALALLILLAGSQLAPEHSNRVQTASAVAWRIPRADIPYPVAVDPRRPNHLLAGAQGQVYESWNGGSQWRRLALLPSGYVIRALAIDAARPGRYVVATLRSIFISSDGGRHWTLTGPSFPGAMNMFLLQAPGRGGTFYLGPSILWKSDDGGVTWTPAGSHNIFAPYGIQSLAVRPDGDLITGIWGGWIAISHDSGRTWQRHTRGLQRNVTDVAVSPRGSIWAATEKGVYRSTDGGISWHRVQALGRRLYDDVADDGEVVLAGGHGVLYRSLDGGSHWQLAMEGLPLNPFVYRLVEVPGHSGRFYVSLNGDGLFRSDDGGATWRPVNAGLPLSGKESQSQPVLFQRRGVLWLTDGEGIDPESLTVDRTVKLAAMSPDGAAAAYLAADGGSWAVRVVSPGASAKLLTSGTGTPPRALSWAPDSSLLAVIRPGSVTVSSPSKPAGHSWSIPGAERFLGWSTDRQSLLFWSARTGRVLAQRWTGGPAGVLGTRVYPSRPLPAPDGAHVAWLWRRQLTISIWHGSPRSVVHVPATCRAGAWSSDSRRLLLICGSRVQERDLAGTLSASTSLPANAIWAPGSSTDLLFFRRGSLWRWSPRGHVRLLVSDAEAMRP